MFNQRRQERNVAINEEILSATENRHAFSIFVGGSVHFDPKENQDLYKSDASKNGFCTLAMK